jgi:hypothetical protein
MVEKYVISRTNGKDVERVNNWFHHCRSNRVPYITISEHTKYATVEWDYISLPMELEAKISENESRLMEGFERIFRKYANPKSVGRLHKNVPRFVDIEISDSKLLAAEVYDFVVEVLGLSVARG